MECFRLARLFRANVGPCLDLWPCIDVGWKMETSDRRNMAIQPTYTWCHNMIHIECLIVSHLLVQNEVLKGSSMVLDIRFAP
jgi:hypothetical protein